MIEILAVWCQGVDIRKLVPTRAWISVAVNRLYEVSWPAWQDAESPAPTLHPQSKPFYASKAFVVHPGKQQPVE